jgi:pSer/pThr/pTyr-binding forkhead associated (FHA) protein
VTAERVTVEDLGSKNGTDVNGHRVRRAHLADGDAILFGTVAGKVIRVAPVPSTQTVR